MPVCASSLPQEQEDLTLADGILVTKGTRVIPEEQLVEEDPVRREEEIALSTKALLEAINRVPGEEEAEDHGDLLTCQEYLREERVEVFGCKLLPDKRILVCCVF